MDKYQLVLQIFAILFICYLFYLLIKFIIAFFKMKRLSIYSLDIKDEKIERNFVFNIIFKFADFLMSLVIFNELGRTYNKYIYGDSRLRKGIDYVSIKILLGILRTKQAEKVANIVPKKEKTKAGKTFISLFLK